MGQGWSGLPLDRVVHLLGASTEALELSAEQLPTDAPATLTYYPQPAPTMKAVVDSLLSKLEHDAVSLYPVWLPGAEQLEGPPAAGVRAVRSLAMTLAAHTHHFGPFLADLAEQAQRGGTGRSTSKYPDEVRAAGLAKVVAASFSRDRTAILVDVPEGLEPNEQRALGAACEWLVGKGGFGIWLTGSALNAAERIETIRFELPNQIAEIVSVTKPDADQQTSRGQIFYPPVAGLPRYNSEAEKLLEKALAAVPWSKGRVWNRAYPARPEFVIDLLWASERCAVEVDGPEHRQQLKFAMDRRRDVYLQLDGYAVLRFTNEQVTGELDKVLGQLRQFLDTKRSEMNRNAL